MTQEIQWPEPGTFEYVASNAAFALTGCVLMVMRGSKEVAAGPSRIEGAKKLVIGALGLPFFVAVAAAETAALAIPRGKK